MSCELLCYIVQNMFDTFKRNRSILYVKCLTSKKHILEVWHAYFVNVHDAFDTFGRNDGFIPSV